MAKKSKIVLAYSGGLDTSIIVKWFQEKGYEVICMVANVGQREDYPELEKKAMASGASKVYISDLRKEFVEDFILPAVQFNANYEGRYLLGTSLARPIIAHEMVRIAKKEKAAYIAHGATGKGNDQVRFELTAYALDPAIKILAPWRDKEFNSLIKGRTEAIDYAKKHNIPIKVSKKKPWSSDENSLHISYEAGILEDPWTGPQESMFELTQSPKKAPSKPEVLEIRFEYGIPVAINDKEMAPLELLLELNRLGGIHGVGRIDIVESRFVGMKSRGVYETPGGKILIDAHRDLETFTADRDVIQLKDTLTPRFSKQVYNGFWYCREMEVLLAMLKESQRFVSGVVKLELYKGNVTIIGRKSDVSLYDEDVASMEDDGGAYNQEDATGFIRLNALPLRAHAKRIHTPAGKAAARKKL